MATGRSRHTTLTDVAGALGVSVGAVSAALNGRPGVGPALRRAIQETAAEMGYSRNRSAVALRTGRSGMVALLIRNLGNPFFLDVAEGFERECATQGVDVLIGSSRYDISREQALVRAFADRAVDALALAPVAGGRAGDVWRSLTTAPTVIINSAAFAPHLSTLRVHSDAGTAMRTAVGHLTALGHRRIGLVAMRPSAEEDRTQHFRAAMRSSGLRPRVLLTADTSWAGVETALRADRARGPHACVTALVTNSDDAAHGVYAAARRLRIDVPADLSVVGNDDLDTSALLSPPLTTHHVNRRALGETAARMLLAALSGDPPQERSPVVVPVSFQERGSTGPPPAWSIRRHGAAGVAPARRREAVP
jgi:DNA-binding LacI/PurR family transcriptional regulator